MNTNKRTPKLRFKGFTDDWEQRKLSDILKVNSGKDYKHLDQGTIPVYGTGGYMLSVNESLSNIDAIGIGRKGTIDKPQYLKAPFWTVDTLFYLTALDKHSILFLYYLMQLIPWKKFDESTGVPSLSKTTIENINGYVPSKPKEEELISALFSQLDKSITLHQRKLDNLKLKKKALLQKLFPKNGERYPELRFPGFTDAWEQRKLDELTIFIGDGLHGTPKYDENGSYYFINGNNLVDNKVSVTEETKKVAFEALGNDDRRLDSTAILMSINGTIGTLARYNNENIMLGKSVAYITPKNINRDFLFYQLQGNVIQSYFYKNLTGTTIKNLGLGTIKNTIVMSTLSEEESTIGRFFYKLDQYITLHQHKLDRLISIKKGLLQQLFV